MQLYGGLHFLDVAKQVTANEYAAPCPQCGGRDRFRIWPDKGKGGSFWCRQCGIRGDGISYLRTFHGVDFQEACKALELSVAEKYVPPVKKREDVQSSKWRLAAKNFLTQCQSHVTVPALQERHLRPETCLTCGIGYNPHDIYPYRSAWGMNTEQGEDGKTHAKIKIPQGIVIATMRENTVLALTVRTHDPKRKYWQIKGSANVPFLLGKAQTPVVLLESALDAVLLHQETGASCVAFMGCTKPPDIATMRFVAQAPLVLACPDNDAAGHTAWPRWHELFPSAVLWPPLEAKDLGDMHALSVMQGGVPSLKDWYRAALHYAKCAP